MIIDKIGVTAQQAKAVLAKEVEVREEIKHLEHPVMLWCGEIFMDRLRFAKVEAYKEDDHTYEVSEVLYSYPSSWLYEGTFIDDEMSARVPKTMVFRLAEDVNRRIIALQKDEALAHSKLALALYAVADFAVAHSLESKAEEVVLRRKEIAAAACRLDNLRRSWLLARGVMLGAPWIYSLDIDLLRELVSFAEENAPDLRIGNLREELARRGA